MSNHTVLIVDDEEDILEEYGSLFEDYPVTVKTRTDPREAIDLLKSDNITVLVSDHKMPEMTGLELVEKAKEVSPNTIRMILTGYAEQDMILEAINVGHVFQFLVKPCEPDKFISLVMDGIDYYIEREKAEKLIDSRGTYIDAKSDMEILQTQLQEREAEIQMLVAENEKRTSARQENFKILFKFLVSLIRIKSDNLFRVGQWVESFSAKVGRNINISEKEKNITRLAAYLKDIGFIVLPDLYMEKPVGMFNQAELQHYYRFPTLGEQILKILPGFSRIATIIGLQLERYDGSGPKGLSQNDIPLPSQIIRVADDTYKILFAREKQAYRETVYGKNYMVNHLRKNLNKLYSMEIGLAAINVLENSLKK